MPDYKTDVCLTCSRHVAAVATDCGNSRCPYPATIIDDGVVVASSVRFKETEQNEEDTWDEELFKERDEKHT